MFKPIHIISIVVAVAFTIFLYWKGNVIPPKSKDASAMQGPMQGGEKPAAANFDSLVAINKKKLSPQAITMLDEAAAKTKSTDNVAAAAAFESMGKIWRENHFDYIAAFYFAESGKLDNSEKKLNFAAHLYAEALKEEKEPAIKQLLATSSVAAYQKSLEINPKNDTVRMDMALVMVNELGQAMEGIQELMAIVKKDSTNLPANLVLGSMAIESQQYDKAIQRGELILKHHKDSWQARLFMAEAYKSKGNTAKALELLNEAKLYNKDPQFVKDVDEYIKTF